MPRGLRLTIRFQRFPRGLSGSRQMARERRCCTNVPCGALGSRQRVPDPAGKPLDERFNEGRGLTEIFCGFAACFFCAGPENNELMERITLGDRYAYQDNSMGRGFDRIDSLRARKLVSSRRLKKS